MNLSSLTFKVVHKKDSNIKKFVGSKDLSDESERSPEW